MNLPALGRCRGLDLDARLGPEQQLHPPRAPTFTLGDDLDQPDAHVLEMNFDAGGDHLFVHAQPGAKVLCMALPDQQPFLGQRRPVGEPRRNPGGVVVEQVSLAGIEPRPERLAVHVRHRPAVTDRGGGGNVQIMAVF